MAIGCAVLCFAACQDPGTPPADGGSDAGALEDGGGGPDGGPDAGNQVTPGDGGWPDATNTGVPPGTSLTASGSLVVTEDQRVIERLDVAGSITVRANQVTIRLNRITSDGTAIELEDGFVGLVVEDVTLDGTSTTTPTAALRLSGNVTLRRLHVFGFGEGVVLFGHGGLIEDCYFHDIQSADGQGSDTLEVWNGHQLVIRHNRLEMSGNDGISVIKLPGDVPVPGGDDVTIHDNLIAGGGWAVYGGYDPPSGEQSWTNVRITHNRFSTRFNERCGYWGPGAFVDSSLASGNVWHETGESLEL